MTAIAPSPIPLTTLIRTLNEADRIAKTIESVLPLGGEILVLDAGSKDDTVAIAEKLGARVISNPWPGFGPQRYFGESQCTHDMVFSVDADEVLTPAMVAEIRALFARADVPRLINVKKAMIFPHHAEPPPFGFCHDQILIYDRRIARTNSNPNWDMLDIAEAAPVHNLKEPLWHYSLRDWYHATTKAAYVAKLAAETKPPRSRLGLVLRLIVEFPLTFLKFYFVRRYFLGGADGFTMAVVSAYGRFIRVAMMLERKDFGGK